jgi:hypothetical protein
MKKYAYAYCTFKQNFKIFMLLTCRQKYQELFRLESRKEKRKVKKRRKSRHKSLDTSAAAASGNKTPKITYSSRAGTHKSQQQHHLHAGTHNSRHHSAASQYSNSVGAIPSIRVESPSAAVKMEAQQQKRQSAISVKNLSSYGGRDEDSDEPRSAAGGDTDDSDSERMKAGGGDESPRTASSSFHETFAKFRQSYLSSATATAPKKV